MAISALLSLRTALGTERQRLEARRPAAGIPPSLQSQRVVHGPRAMAELLERGRRRARQHRSTAGDTGSSFHRLRDVESGYGE